MGRVVDCLPPTVCSDLRRQVRTYLHQAASHKHMLHRRQANKARRADSGAEASAAVHRHMPEYCLPFAIHLLAHHPSFDEAKLGAPTTQLSFLLDGLVGGMLRNCRQHDCGRDEADMCCSCASSAHS